MSASLTSVTNRGNTTSVIASLQRQLTEATFDEDRSVRSGYDLRSVVHEEVVAEASMPSTHSSTNNHLGRRGLQLNFHEWTDEHVSVRNFVELRCQVCSQPMRARRHRHHMPVEPVSRAPIAVTRYGNRHRISVKIQTWPATASATGDSNGHSSGPTDPRAGNRACCILCNASHQHFAPRLPATSSA